jgi:hypothetical protein
MSKIGGGVSEVPKLTSLEENIISIIGKTAVDGMSSGIDA